ncbi:hypothetical protein GCM10027063_41810 [Promicromonospora xylanilytica]
MDRNFRRVLYTALVAGGLAVVGASSAHAAGEGPPDPVTQETTATTEHASVTGGDLDAATSPAATGAETQGAGVGTSDETGLADDVVGPDGIVRSLLSADLADVVDGTLGEDGLVDDLLTGVPSGDDEAPLPEEPGTDAPGAVDPPGTDEPGTDEPGTDEPGTDEPGTDTPGTDEPGTDKPGTDKPGTAGPGRPGTGSHDPGPRPAHPGAGDEGTDAPADSHAPKPRTPESGTTEPRTTEPRTTEPRTGYSGGYPVSAGTPGAIPVGHVPSDSAVPARAAVQPVRGTAEPMGEHPLVQGVDLTWGATGGSVPTSSSGSIRSGDMDDRPHRPVTEPVAEPVARRVVPDADLAETGHMITGQLSLISLLMGLGIAALRTRRR